MILFKSFDKKKLVFAIVVVAVVVIGAVVGVKKLSHETRYISGTLVDRSLDDLYEQSALVAMGTITGKSKAFQIQHVSGPIANFTDYYFEVSNALRGTVESDTIIVRVQGGTVGNYTEIYEFSPSLEINNEYLLFLYKPGRGGAYNTEGDYYYILGLTQGSFSEDKDGNFVSESGETLTQESLISALSAEDAEPIDEDYFRNEYIENQKRNLQNGFITQEEFDEIMANIDRYATIVN